MLVREIIAKRREQKRAELPAVAIRQGNAVIFQERKDEPLGQVLRIFGGMSLPAREVIKRAPIFSA